MNPNPYINDELQALAESVRRFADEKNQTRLSGT